MPEPKLLLSLMIGFAVGCSSVLTDRLPLHPDNPPGTWYIVQPGETLADIAARARVPVEDLLELNGLQASDPVPPGRLVYVLYGDDVRLSMASLPANPAPPNAVSMQERPPLRWPVAEPRVTSPFGTRQGRVHEGIDLGMPIGTPIYAADAGRVLYAGNAVRGYGNMVVLEHAGDLVTVYAHNSILLVKIGDRIAVGQEIARAGQSGRASGPHLHFEVRARQVPRDPLHFLPAPKSSR